MSSNIQNSGSKQKVLEPEKDKMKIYVMPTEGAEEDETCQTFVLNNEDHTLGNSLRYMIMKNPDTQFCGYSIPHPSEEKINFRIQTYGKPSIDVLRKGLKDLNTVCEHVLRTFETSINEHKRRNQSDIEAMDQSTG
ncbi:DNA-directed RNA polymerases I and III subunit RPAC2-like [Ruditapes philippinarum]|uniref:DNA-directed RNA polymerases I and III subunit RPAC2-like n=1 Tax=Ruditapes philippinarum TaxID=129788 RepID=UPI00295BAD0F|nr:DNA-directed RNA polymerases I and III subunit RPAC2-like [Ruditapes philippinarum]